MPASLIRSHAHSMRRPPSLTQKIIQIFCSILNAFAFNMDRSLTSNPHKDKKEEDLQPSSFFSCAREDLPASLIRSHAHSMRRPPSLTQKIIQIFCSILNAFAFNMDRSLTSNPHKDKKEEDLQPSSFFSCAREDLPASLIRSHAHSMRRPPSLTQKIIQIFCSILNAFAFNMDRSLTSNPHKDKKEEDLQPSSFFSCAREDLNP